MKASMMDPFDQYWMAGSVERVIRQLVLSFDHFLRDHIMHAIQKFEKQGRG
jgi:hypothetical protein